MSAGTGTPARPGLAKRIVARMREADRAPRRRRLFRSDVLQGVYDVVFFPIMVFLPSSWVSAIGMTTIRDHRIEAVKRHVRGFLLDVGAGWDNRLVEEYGNGVGFDIQWWEGYEGTHSRRLAICRSDRMCFRDATFDTVTVVAVLNHIPNREEVLTEIRRVLKDDGQMILTMVAPWISWINHNLRALYDPDRDRRWDEREVWGLTGPQMAKLIADARFTLARKVPYFFGLSEMYICRKAR